MKLGTRLVIIFFSIIFVPLFFMGLILYKNSERVILEHTLNHLRTLSLLIEARVEDTYKRYRDHLTIAAHRPSLYRALDAFFESNIDQNRQNVKDALIKFAPVYEGMEEMYVFDLKGDLIAGTNSYWDGKNVSQEVFFKEGQTKEFFDLIKMNPEANYPGRIILAAPVAPHSGTQAVVLIMLNTEPLAEIASTYLKIGKSEDILFGRRNTNGDIEFVSPRKYGDDKNALHIIPKNQEQIPMTHAISGQELLLDDAIDYRGHRVLAATNYAEGLGLGIVVKIDREEFYKPIHGLNKITIVFGSIVAFFTIFIALIVSRSLSQPIVRLSKAANRISKGDLDVQLPKVEENDEIGILTRSVEKMSKSLILSNRNLEHEVMLRTRQLQRRLDELELTNKVGVGRELRMIELKKKINELSLKLNLQAPYDLNFLNENQRDA